MENFKYLIVGLMVVFATAQDSTVTKCQVVTALQAEGVTDTAELRNWLCLVDHGSSYQYDFSESSFGTTYSGIFRMDNSKWCDQRIGYSGTDCCSLTLNANGCLDACSSFLDASIADDASCAVRVKNCQGFAEWDTWSNNCDGEDLSGSKYDPTCA